MRRCVLLIVLLSAFPAPAAKQSLRQQFDALVVAFQNATDHAPSSGAWQFGRGDDDDGDGELDAIVGEYGQTVETLGATTLDLGNAGVVAIRYQETGEYVDNGEVRATALLERIDGGWRFVASHWSEPLNDTKNLGKVRGKLGALPGLETEVGAGAEDVVALFERALADPGALVDTVSSRKETTFFFSDRLVKGGKKVRRALVKAGFTFELVGGVRAGLTASGEMAWVAAHVNGTRAKQKTSIPYRVLFVYESTEDGWRLIAGHMAREREAPILDTKVIE